MEENVSCSNCVCQNVCKAYIDLKDMIAAFNGINGKIVKIPFQAEILAPTCANFLSPSDVKSDLLNKRNRVDPESTLTPPEDQ